MNILNLLNQNEKEKISYLNLKQNQILFHEGEECKSIFIIIEGQITILNYSLNGNEEIISILNKNDVFANALIFSNNNYYLGEIIATKPTKLAIINKNELISLLQKYRQAAYKRLRAICSAIFRLAFHCRQYRPSEMNFRS